ncbi:MAG: Fic family protein [Isosphaerales bacterium]
MRTPVRPPSQGEIGKPLTAERFLAIMNHVEGPTVRGRYCHWDKLRHLTPPAGLTHPEWWFGLKLRRHGSKPIPLRDKAGAAFTFNMVDPLPESMHHVDSLAHGVIQQPEPVTNPETRDSYLVRSLIEESITSSQLEGASTTRAVAKKMIREGRAPRDRSERMIFNNYRTMQHILEIKDEYISSDLLCEIHSMVTDGTLNDQSAAGRFRRSDEEVEVTDEYGEVFHVPPPAKELKGRVDEMCKFANCETPGGFIHPVLRSMILHFWLAYDHPFVDGNGRTARALFYWSMLKRGYWLFEYISISKVIHSGPAKYGEAFLYSETDDNDLTYFLLYHADVINRAIDELYQYIDRHTKQLADAQKDLEGFTILNYRQRDLISHALRHPGQSFTTESHRNSHQVAYETARSDLMDLADRALIRKRKVGRTWIFTPAADLAEKLRRLN